MLLIGVITFLPSNLFIVCILSSPTVHSVQSVGKINQVQQASVYYEGPSLKYRKLSSINAAVTEYCPHILINKCCPYGNNRNFAYSYCTLKSKEMGVKCLARVVTLCLAICKTVYLASFK